jgi:hypothetical protein
MPDFMNVATLTKQVNNNLPPKRFLSSFFQTETLKTVNAELDTVEGTHLLAPFKREGAKRTITKRAGYNKRPFHCYEIALERPTDAFDVLKAQPGEPAVLVDPMDPNDRQAFILGNDTTDLSNRINRTIEMICSKALFEAGYDILDEDGKVIDSISFDVKTSHKITKAGDYLWTGSGADVIGDLSDLDTVVNEDSGLAVADKIFGSAAWKAARANDKFMKDFDRIHVTGNSMDLGGGVNSNGAKLVGYHNGSRIWIYNDSYTVNKNKAFFVPKDKVLAIGEGLAAKLYFGCVGNVKDGWFRAERFAKTIYDEDEEIQKLIMKSRPLAVLQQPNGIAWAKVVNL